MAKTTILPFGNSPYTTYKYKTAVSIIKDGVVDNQQIGKIAPTVAKESVVFCSPAPNVNSARPIPVQEHRAFGERSFL